jgi:phosphotransferase system enzyme I (PtsI)
VLVGLGATSLSMAPTALADVRASLLQHSLDDARVIAEAALAANGAASAREAARAAATTTQKAAHAAVQS